MYLTMIDIIVIGDQLFRLFPNMANYLSPTHSGVGLLRGLLQVLNLNLEQICLALKTGPGLRQRQGLFPCINLKFLSFNFYI